MDRVAKAGRVDILRFLHENRNEECTTEAIDRAASRGHLEVVEFLHEYRTEGCTTSAMDDAAVSGHLEVAKFLHRNRKEGCIASAMENAAKNGHVAVVKFLHENRLGDCTQEAMSGAAATNETFDVVRYLLAHRKEDDSVGDALRSAAQSSNVEIFQFILENRGPGDVVVIPTYSSFMRLDTHEVVKLIYIHAPEACSAKLLSEAAGNEEAQIVRALCRYSNSGCPFEARAVAAKEGYANVVEVLDDSCPRCARVLSRSGRAGRASQVSKSMLHVVGSG